MVRWLWWSTLILLLLRQQSAIANSVEGGEENGTSIEESPGDVRGPLTADQLGVPRCTSNYECVSNGLCFKGKGDAYGRCLCPRSCSSLIPLTCRAPNRRNMMGTLPCLVMGEDYTNRFALNDPFCFGGRCVCPPMFDAVNHTKLPIKELLPTKCDKRELKALTVAYPSEEVYKGTDVTLYCCVNIDPANFIDASGVTFIQNDTVTRDATKHPFRETREYDILMAPSCWELEIRNVQPVDSGTYMCMVNPANPFPPVNHTVTLKVKVHEKRHRQGVPRRVANEKRSPRMIHNLSVSPNETAVNVTWDVPEGSKLNISASLRRRTGNVKQSFIVWSTVNATSPLSIGDLRAATPYTLSINISDGHMEPFPILEHFITSDGQSNPPRPVTVRVGISSGLSSGGSSLHCEVEWKPPSIPKGRISKYYVRVQGELRQPRPGHLVPLDYPAAIEKKCANYDETEQASQGINPIDFSNELHFCKYGPLKPNRNYTVTIWAENGAGKSTPLVFEEQCLTHFAQPDHVEKPSSQIGSNHTSFKLTFNSKPDDINGPISCYYIAVVPLPSNVSIDSLPDPQDMVVDSFAKAFSNNLQQGANDRKVYFAYIAESYKQLPPETIIGDGEPVPGMRQCNVQYLSRHKAEDRALRPSMKYTGFLIVRVDRINPYGSPKEEPMKGVGRRFVRNVQWDSRLSDRENLPRAVGGKRVSPRTMRQLHLSGPVYGFSGYFKPVLLTETSGNSGVLTALLIVGSILVFLVLVGGSVIVFMQKRGMMVPTWCPLKLAKDTSERMLLRPSYQPIPIEDLPSEYLIRHRDSDFLFTQEYESLPLISLEATASCRKENTCKNRYNDIRAYDGTRVKLKQIGFEETTDYINANYIKSWNGQKKFIAAQAPLENTIEDFWRMALEQDCRIIVMVANLVEKNRSQCIKYWPDDRSQRYGKIKVTLVSSDYNAFYTVRTFDIVELDRHSPDRSSFSGSTGSEMDSEYANVPSTRVNGKVDINRVRRIYQYHFTNWNDYRAPECTTGLLRFLHRLRSIPEFNEYPVIIHCSAGVGRTGTFIAIDGMLDQAIKENKVDIHGFVSGLRKQRNLMVQSLEQYVFVYKALAEWYLFGDTDMDPSELDGHYMMLMDPAMRHRSHSSSSNLRTAVVRSDNNIPVNGMEVEYRKLEQTLESGPKISFAKRDDNILRNRFDAAVPFDRNRVVLCPMLGYSDYYNASELKGYFYPYILAQDPVSDCAVFDFWRMVDGKEVSTIVMLSSEEDWSQSEKYWPEELHVEHVIEKHPHKFVVTLESEDRYPYEKPYYMVRKMHYRSSASSKPRSLWQFCILDWPTDAAVPATTKSLRELIGKVLERQSKQPDSGPIILHCRDGSSRTGVFCCVSLLLERLKAEQRVDVFQTVKGLQLQRPLIINSVEQYDFCYRAVLDYIRT